MIVLPVLTLDSSAIAGLLLVEIIPDVVLDGVPVPGQGEYQQKYPGVVNFH